MDANATQAAARAFPAHAGMILTIGATGSVLTSVPRTRGDDPRVVADLDGVLERSPHTRG